MESFTIEIKRLRTLALEIFKTLNNLNLNFMKDTYIFPFKAPIEMSYRNGMTYLFRLEKQQNMVITVSGLRVYI